MNNAAVEARLTATDEQPVHAGSGERILLVDDETSLVRLGEEMIAELARRQRPDGRWFNDADRWEESRPELATIYACLALEEALKPRLGME